MGKKQDKHKTGRFLDQGQRSYLTLEKISRELSLHVSSSENEGLGILLVSKFLSGSSTGKALVGLWFDGIRDEQRRKKREESSEHQSWASIPDVATRFPKQPCSSQDRHITHSHFIAVHLEISWLAQSREFNPGWKTVPKNLDLLPSGLLESSFNITFQL